MSLPSVVVVGGYGNFGRRIARDLATEPGHRVLIAGRNGAEASRAASAIGGNTEPLILDCAAGDLAEKLQLAGAKLVIHAAGPFQAQSYAVPRACVAARAHYVDLADARAFVSDIGVLHEAARRNDILVASGASTLPALSSAVVDHLARAFASIESIEYAITSGARPPGLATMNGVLAYAGKPFVRWQDGRWQTVHGWLGLRRRHFAGPVGRRWVANCDVPDLALFPRRYPTAGSVVFRAGVAQRTSMLAIWLGACTVRAGLLRSMVPLVPRLHRIALARARRGSRDSAMQVQVCGVDAAARRLTRTWTLLAGSDHGPYIPCFPAVALARKLLRGEVSTRGAMPCMGLLDLQEILAVGHGLQLEVVES